MKESFRLTRAAVLSTDSASLKAAILDATGSESGTESILRSLERMGTDASIEYFELMEIAEPRRHRGAVSAAWRVRADRGHAEELSP